MSHLFRPMAPVCQERNQVDGIEWEVSVEEE